MKIVAVLLWASLAFTADPGGRVEYVGGTRSDIAGSTEGVIQATDEVYFAFYGKKVRVRVPYEKINLLEYGQKVDRRYAMAVIVSPLLLLSKKRQHFLTVGYLDEYGREQALVFRVSKSHIRATLAVLEARTGRKIEYQDNEARKAGRG